MCAGADIFDQAVFHVEIELVGQQKMYADRALPLPDLVAAQRVIEPRCAKWGIVGDQQEHGVLQPVHVVPAPRDKCSHSSFKDFA